MIKSVVEASNTLAARLVTGPLEKQVKEAYASIQPDLDLVENRIKVVFDSDAPKLSEIGAYLLELGGKRMRPSLALLSARLFGMEKPTSEMVDAGAGIELIHMATLLHDDIIDRSSMRRRKESAFVKYGLPSTLLAGDFLLVRAFGICAKLDSFLTQATEKACIELTEGEELEGILDFQSEHTMATYLDIVSKKTASLFSLACVGGAFLAGANPAVVAIMERFGRNLGIAFQMIDDILDVTADDEVLGKPAGTDLKQKTPSLVNILWLESGDPKAKEFFLLEEPTLAEAKSILAYLKSTQIVEQAQKIAKDYAERAERDLAEVESFQECSATAEQLRAIVNYTLNRCL